MPRRSGAGGGWIDTGSKNHEAGGGFVDGDFGEVANEIETAEGEGGLHLLRTPGEAADGDGLAVDFVGGTERDAGEADKIGGFEDKLIAGEGIRGGGDYIPWAADVRGRGGADEG